MRFVALNYSAGVMQLLPGNPPLNILCLLTVLIIINHFTYLKHILLASDYVQDLLKFNTYKSGTSDPDFP